MNKMNRIIKIALAMVVYIAFPVNLFAQDSVKNDLNLSLGYFMNNNKVVYLKATTKSKIKGKFVQIKGIHINLFLDTDSTANLIGKVTTDDKGIAKAVLPPALKAVWDGAAKHNFIAVSEATKEFESTTAEATITKSKIVIDTLNEDAVRSISITVTALNRTSWEPAPDLEMKVGIGRLLGGFLTVGEEATYTTDSSGTVVAALSRKNIPGDENGNIILVAKVEDNELLGNLTVNKTVRWGEAVKSNDGFFNQRTLWSTRFRTPLWLLFMAYSIVIGVWGTIIYLILQIFKIKKLGTATT